MMHFYSLTLQEPQHVINATAGNFTGISKEGVDEIIVNLGTHLSLYRHTTHPISEEQSFTHVLTRPAFCHVFSVKTLSFPENTHDYLCFTSDSGNISIFDLKDEKFTQVSCIPFARTGMRRFEPGYYLNISPCGRAILSASIEKYKIAWPVSQTEENKPLVAAPIETTRSHSYVHSSVALDVGYESPLFAFIERIFKPDKTKKEPLFEPKKNQKFLVLYEVDPSIKSIVRRGEHPISSSASHLVAVPGKLFNCPGGVIVCSTGNVQYFPRTGEPFLASIPIRKGDEPSIIISSATFTNGSMWFALIQNQFGDLMIVTSEEEGQIAVKYFDTIPLATSLLILRQGVLAAFGESNSNSFYAIKDIAGIDDLEFTPNEGSLVNLELISTTQTMGRLVKMAVVNSAYGAISGDMITIHGSGPQSSLKYSRRGIPIDIIKVEKLGGQNMQIRTIKKDPLDQYDSYVFITTLSTTRVLEVFEDGRISDVESSADKKNDVFVFDKPTIDVFQMCTVYSHSTVQVHTKGLRVITKNLTSAKNWAREGYSGHIVAAASNASQVVVAYDDMTLTLFEADTNALPAEISSAKLDNIEGQIVALAIPQPPEGIKITKWLAIATDRMMIFIISLGDSQSSLLSSQQDSESKSAESSISSRWQISARQMVNDPISSIAFLAVPGVGQVLHIGHENGVLQRAILDDNEGRIDMPQIRFLGHSPVHFCRIVINGQRCLLANATAPYLIRGLSVTQFAAPTFMTLCQIFASFCPEGGFIGVSESDLVIYEMSDINSSMSTISHSLPMTPRHIVPIPDTETAFVVCSDLVDGIWRSLFFVYNYANNINELSQPYEYEPGFCATAAEFIPSINAVCVGFAGNLRFNPRSSTGGRVCLFDHTTGTIHHQTDVEDIPGAIGVSDDEELICGIGKIIRVYKVGMSVLLKRCESKTMPFFISFVSTVGSRIVVGDSAESYHFLKFDRQLSIMTPFCDDATPRFPLSSALLDRATIALGDRFGNFAVLRVPPEVSDEAEVDPSGVGMVWEHHDFSGTPNKFDLAASFHVGDPITAIRLSSSGQCLLYGTVAGSLGAMVPLANDTDASILKKLEAEMRKRAPTLSGRVHALFRSYYEPVTNVTDGDLVKNFMEMSDAEQKAIAMEMKCTPFDISRLLVSIESMI